MNNNIKKVSVFVIITLAIICILQYGIDYVYKKRSTDKYALLFRHEIDPELMIFGSSTAIKHYNPRVIKKLTGLSYYNMGYDGLFYMQNIPLVKEYLTYVKNCKYMVISCSPYLGKDWGIMAADFFYPYMTDGPVYKYYHQIEPAKVFKARYVPGYKLTLLNKAFYWRIVHQPKADTNLGFEGINEINQVFDTIPPYMQIYDEDMLQQIKSLTREVSAKGIKVFLVMSPYYVEADKYMLNMKYILSRYKSIEDTSKGIYFMDYTTDTLALHKKYFFSHTHLNAEGNEIFSNTFSHDMMALINKTQPTPNALRPVERYTK